MSRSRVKSKKMIRLYTSGFPSEPICIMENGKETTIPLFDFFCRERDRLEALGRKVRIERPNRGKCHFLVNNLIEPKPKPQKLPCANGMKRRYVKGGDR